MAFERQRDFDARAQGARGAGAQLHQGHRVVQAQPRQQRGHRRRPPSWPSWRWCRRAVNHHKAAQDLKKLAAAQKQPDPKMLENISNGVRAGRRGLREVSRAISQLEEHLRIFVFIRRDALLLGPLPRRGGAVREGPRLEPRQQVRRGRGVQRGQVVREVRRAADRRRASTRSRRCPPSARSQTPVTPMQIPDDGGEAADGLRRVRAARARLGPRADDDLQGGGDRLRYLHWDDARPRMEQIVTKYCKDDMGANAGNAILVTYTIEKNLDKIEEWADALEGGQLRHGADGAEERGRAAASCRWACKFQKADKLFADKKYEEAAQLYVQIVDADPQERGRRQGAQQRRRRLRERQALRRGDQAVRAHRQRLSDLEVRRRCRRNGMRSKAGTAIGISAASCPTGTTAARSAAWSSPSPGFPK